MKTMVTSRPMLIPAVIACSGVLSINFFLVRDGFVDKERYFSICSVLCVSFFD